ncbi:hypothetical protein NIES23_60800 (plasmid) [Trichormus variabilis NIES-23]|uniref:Uncharacterized protein n=1 Tax=Trichormus variabilis NIES-23 TaxID=1973479 RepID=A0A1Z4KWI4_ANAVA|nr:hypothetical protein NIES23_60800 [Trichormus variabilis NIES-23]
MSMKLIAAGTSSRKPETCKAQATGDDSDDPPSLKTGNEGENSSNLKRLLLLSSDRFLNRNTWLHRGQILSTALCCWLLKFCYKRSPESGRHLNYYYCLN